MKSKKLLRKIQKLLNADRRAQLAKYDSLEKVLKELEKKEEALRVKLNEEGDEDQLRTLLRKLEVIEAQRNKGLALQRELAALHETE